MFKPLFCCAAFLFALSSLQGQTLNPVPNPPGNKNIPVDHCMVFSIEDIDVPASISGQLIEVNVKEGQSVDKDQQLAKVDDRMAQLQLQSAQNKFNAMKFQAEDETNINYAQAVHKVAKNQYDRHWPLFRQNTISKTEWEQYEFKELEARLGIEKAKRTRELASKELLVEEQNVAIAKAATEQYVVNSPINGTVKELLVSNGEWVQAGDKVMQVVRMDKLWIEGFVDGELYDPYQVDGRRVTVTATLANNRTETFLGKIIFVGLEQKVGSRYVVRAEIKNRLAGAGSHWLLLPGSSVNMRIHLD